MRLLELLLRWRLYFGLVGDVVGEDGSFVVGEEKVVGTAKDGTGFREVGFSCKGDRDRDR